VVLVLTARASSGAPLLEHLMQKGFEAQVIEIHKTPDWLSQLLASPPGAVVLDFEPASEQGWKFIEALKQDPATEDIPVLFYSLLEAEDRGSVLALEYLPKPLSTASLARALERQGLVCAEEGEGRTVLVVDDDPHILDLHARMVQTQLPTYRVSKCKNGREALAEMQRLRPALVLLDLMMPELDGFGVLEAMREDERTRDVPVVVLTAQALREQDMARLRRGVAAVLAKGVFSAQETLAHVEGALARSKRLRGETQWLVRKGMAHIHERYAEPISREDIAEYVGVSPGHLTRCFRREVGVTPIEYLNRYRIRQSKALLGMGDRNITEVALEVGFADSNYFSRIFRREEGVSPTAYQRGERCLPD